MTETAVNPLKLSQELLNAGLPVAGVSSDGRVDYTRDLTSSERAAAEAVIASHDPALSVEESRIQAYFESGLSLQDLVLALWKKIMQDDPSSANEIQTQMEAIDLEIN